MAVICGYEGDTETEGSKVLASADTDTDHSLLTTFSYSPRTR